MSEVGKAYRQALTLVGCAALGLPLLLYAWSGSFMRLTGDDYCYSGLFRQNGIWETLRMTYLGPSPFHGNRFSLTLSAALVDAINPLGWSLLTALTMIVWIGGMAWFLQVLASAASIQATRVEALLTAEALAFFSLALAPALEQSLYWRSGMLPYLTPLAIIPILGAQIASPPDQSNRRTVRLGAVAALAFFSAGFSETIAAFQLTVLMIAAGIPIAMRKGLGLSSELWRLLGAGLVGTGAATILLAAAPTNSYRLAGLQGVESVIDLVRLVLHHAYLFLHGLAFRQVLPLASLAVVTTWLGFGVGRRFASLTIQPRDMFVVGGLLAAGGSAAVLAVMAPSAYVQSSYPVGRALLPAAFAATVVVAGLGIVIGGHLARFGYRGAAVTWVLTLSFVAAIAIEPGQAALQAWGELPKYQRWASFWDVRDVEIRAARAAGNSEVEVILMDKIIPDVSELQQDPEHWYNNCAEWYYDIDRLSANLPGWDE